MIIAYEPQCRGIEHAEINAAFLILLEKAKPGESIVFYGDSEHLTSVRMAIDSLGHSNCSSRLECRPIQVPNPKTFIILRLLSELTRLIAIVFANTKRTKNNTYILLSSTSATLLAAKVIQHFISKPIFIILHGILESITCRPQSLLKRFAWFRNYLPISRRSKIRYLTTASFIKRNLLFEIPSLDGHVFHLDFPYIFRDDQHSVNRIKSFNSYNGSQPVTITSAGVGSLKKGTGDFFKLADTVSQQYGKSVLFIYAGRLADEELNARIPECVNALVDAKMLSQIKYNEVLQHTDYLVFFYPPNSYKFGVSGVLLDAIKYEIPVIAISNEFFEYCVDTIGKIGWLCVSTKEIQDTIKRIIKDPPLQELHEIGLNYKHFKQQYTPEAQALRLAEILNYES